MQTGKFGPKVPRSTPARSDGASSDRANESDPRGFSLNYQGFGKVFRKSDPGSAFIFRRDGTHGLETDQRGHVSGPTSWRRVQTTVPTQGMRLG